MFQDPYGLIEEFQISRALNDDLAHTLLQGEEVVGLVVVDVDDGRLKLLFHDFGHFVLVLAPAMVLDGQDDGGVDDVFPVESGYFFDDVFEFDRCCCSVSMFDDGPTVPIMDIDLHAPNPILQVLQIPFYLGIAGELISSQVCVVR